MKTNELEKLLGITKDTLRYYEKEKLISPSRDDNGYRNYSHEDIRIIKNIIMLRSFDLSIEDIRCIFNNEISLNACLNQKKEYLLKEIGKKQRIIDSIEKNLSRKKAFLGYLQIPVEIENEIYVLFSNEEITIRENLERIIKYNYQDIKKVVFSICSRTYIPALAGNHGYLLFATRPHIGLLSRYYVDLDIYAEYSCHLFESISLDNIHEIFAILKANNIIIEDPLNLVSVFTQYRNQHDLEKYFDNNMPKWQKKYGLDNPRGSEIYQQIDEFRTYINNTGKEKSGNKLFIVKSLLNSGFPKRAVVIFILVLILPLSLFIIGMIMFAFK